MSLLFRAQPNGQLGFRHFLRSEGPVYQFANAEFFPQASGQNAILTVLSHSLDKISDKTGKTTCSVTFSTDISIGSWEARATYESQTPGAGVGWVVGSGGAVNQGVTETFDVTYDELVYGDRVYTISVYVNTDFLYNQGDECAALTGGWNTMAYRQTYTDIHTVTENISDVQITCRGAVSSTGQTLYTHETGIDLTNYTTLHCIGNVQHTGDNFGIAIMDAKHSGVVAGSYTTWSGLKTYKTDSSLTDLEVECDIRDLSGLHYIYMVCAEGYDGANVQTIGTFKKLWLT